MVFHHHSNLDGLSISEGTGFKWVLEISGKVKHLNHISVWIMMTRRLNVKPLTLAASKNTEKWKHRKGNDGTMRMLYPNYDVCYWTCSKSYTVNNNGCSCCISPNCQMSLNKNTQHPSIGPNQAE